jgi:uncharacterized RDD family membrane protein YckC
MALGLGPNEILQTMLILAILIMLLPGVLAAIGFYVWKKRYPEKIERGRTKTVRYAGFFIRLIAYFIDTAVIFVSMIVVAIFFLTLSYILQISFLALLAFLISPIVSLLYFPYFLATKGTTPGKSYVGLVVVDKTNRYPLTWGKALIRESVGRMFVDGLIFHLGNLLIFFDPKKQSLHDKIAGTYVVYKETLRSD